MYTNVTKIHREDLTKMVLPLKKTDLYVFITSGTFLVLGLISFYIKAIDFFVTMIAIILSLIFFIFANILKCSLKKQIESFPRLTEYDFRFGATKFVVNIKSDSETTEVEVNNTSITKYKFEGNFHYLYVTNLVFYMVSDYGFETLEEKQMFIDTFAKTGE